MITVVIPLYNKENCITRTINSVLKQTITDFELIIVNDGSTDGSLFEAEKIVDSRIKIIDKKNGGVSSARNAGINSAKYEYIAFLDGDDVWLPDHLETIESLINEYGHQASIFVTSIARARTLSEIKPISHEKSASHLILDYFCEASKPHSTISSSNFAIKKDIAINSGLFNINLSYGEDVEFWHKILKNGALAKSEKVTAYYFVGAENRSNGKVIPLHFRYHNFDFKSASHSERQYLGKLVCLIIIDYLKQKKYSICIKVFNMYKTQIIYIFRYLYLLIKKNYIRRNSIDS